MSEIMQNYEIIRKIYEKIEDFNKTYFNCLERKDAESCYEFLKRWNRGIGMLNSQNNKNNIIKKLNEILYKINKCDDKEFFIFINKKLNESIENKRDLRIPTIKLFHILMDGKYPLIDNDIADYYTNRKNYLQQYQNRPEKLFDFINSYKECIYDSFKKYFKNAEPNYKIIDEYLFLKIQRGIKTEVDNEFKDFINNVTICLKSKRKNKEIL